MLEVIPEDEEDCPEDDPDCEPVKRSLWQRLLHRNRSRKEEIKRKIKSKTTIPDNQSLDISRPPFVSISDLADSSVVFAVRAWTHNSNYWPLYFEMYEKFYSELPLKGFEFPFPQMDVHFPDAPQNFALK